MRKSLIDEETDIIQMKRYQIYMYTVYLYIVIQYTYIYVYSIYTWVWQNTHEIHMIHVIDRLYIKVLQKST